MNPEHKEKVVALYKQSWFVEVEEIECGIFKIVARDQQIINPRDKKQLRQRNRKLTDTSMMF